MAEQVTNDSTSGLDEFLIAEHEHFADSFWRTEELGEKRLNFFISLLTAVVAGLVVLATSDSGFSDAQVQWISFSAGLALLLLGLSTFLRMLRRNEVTDQYKDAMELIRESFRARYALEGYAPIESLPRRLFTGGLAQTAALLNSVLAGGVAAVGLVEAASAAWLAVAGGLVFALALGAQFAYIRLRNRRG